MEANDDEEDDDDDEDEEGEEEEEEEEDDENLTVTMPNSFPLPSPPSNDENFQVGSEDKSSEMPNSSFTLLERLENIVPKNLLEVLKTVDVNSNELHTNTNTTGMFISHFITLSFFHLDISAYPWPSTDRLPSPTNDENKKLLLLGRFHPFDRSDVVS